MCCRYCLADDRLAEAVKFLDLGGGSGWELLQVLWNHCKAYTNQYSIQIP